MIFFHAACDRSSSSSRASAGHRCATGDHHRVNTLGEELRGHAVHGSLLVPVGNLNQSRLVEGACSNLKGGRGTKGCVKTLQTAHVSSDESSGVPTLSRKPRQLMRPHSARWPAVWVNMSAMLVLDCHWYGFHGGTTKLWQA